MSSATKDAAKNEKLNHFNPSAAVPHIIEAKGDQTSAERGGTFNSIVS